MTSVVLFDSESCCQSAADGGAGARGVAEFVAASKRLADHGVIAQRFTLSSAPEEFVANGDVAALLAASGTAALPALVVNGELKASGRYPSTLELFAWTGLNLMADDAACCSDSARSSADACCSTDSARSSADACCSDSAQQAGDACCATAPGAASATAPAARNDAACCSPAEAATATTAVR